MNYWLMKSEPEAFSIDDLKNANNKTTFWDGVRNYQARNMMRDQMQIGDHAFFYHSNCKVPGIVGIMTVVKTAYADKTQFDPESKYYDPKSTPEKPRWFGVELKWQQKFNDIIPLETLKQIPSLKDMPLVRKGNRLSIMPVSKKEWETILKLT
jgi:predicted RNA-binding protein with PUA-like domain